MRIPTILRGAVQIASLFYNGSVLAFPIPIDSFLYIPAPRAPPALVDLFVLDAAMLARVRAVTWVQLL